MNYTSANSHLGDIAWHCQIMQRIQPQCGRFIVPQEYFWQTQEMLEGCDVKAQTVDMPGTYAEAVSTWIACGRFEQNGVRYEHNIDLVEYLCHWADQIALENGSAHKFERADLLSSFPAILRNVAAPEFDVLVINSPPRSGQCPGWDQGEMDVLIEQINHKNKVICTNATDAGVSVISGSLCNIGNLSLRAKLVIGVASGPIWGALNIWRTCPIYLFLDPIKLDYGAGPIPAAASVDAMWDLLNKDGYL